MSRVLSPTYLSHRQYCYVTYFDQHYAARGLAMIASIFQHDPSSHVFVLALDSMIPLILSEKFGDRVTVISIQQLYDFEPLLRACEDRSPWERYATQKPVLLQYVLAISTYLSIIYVDADFFFFADPSGFLKEVSGYSIAISPHRFRDDMTYCQQYGVYNAGFIYMRKDSYAGNCLDDWRNHCLAWCYNRVESDGRFMNQGYLNDWPSRYLNLKVIRHPGVNLAFWNLDACRLMILDSVVSVNNAPLICYHFSGLVRNANGEWYSWYAGNRQHFMLASKLLYDHYLGFVKTISEQLLSVYGINGLGNVRNLEPNERMVMVGDDGARFPGMSHTSRFV